MKISRYCEHTIIAALIVLIMAVPLYFDVRLYSVFDLTKVVAMIIPSLLIMAVWLIKIIFNEEFRFPNTPLNLPILAFITIVIIATLFSVNPYMSLMGGYKRFEGLIETCTYVFIFFAFATFVNNIRKLNLVINAIVATGVITSVYGFIQYFGKDIYHWSSVNPERIFSTFGNPVFYSAFLITVLPLSLALYMGYQRKTVSSWQLAVGNIHKQDTRAASNQQQAAVNKNLAKDIIYGFCTLIIYTIFWHTKTRADFVGLIVLLPLFVIFLGRERIYAYRWKLSIMLALFIAIGTFYSIRPQSSVFSYFAQEVSLVDVKDEKEIKDNVKKGPNADDRSFLVNKLSGSSFNRYYQFKTGLKIFNEHPILGLGPDALGILYQKYLAKVFTRRQEDEGWPRHDKIHNDILDNVAARGAIGLSTYIWLVLAYFWLVWKSLKAEKSISSKLKAQSSRDASSRLKVQSSRLIYQYTPHLLHSHPPQEGIDNHQSPIDKRLLIVCFGSAIIGYIVQNEFSFGNTPIVALFWTILALTVVVINGLRVNPESRSATPGPRTTNRVPRKILLSALVISLITFLTIHIVRWYKADIYMEIGRRYTSAGDFENGIKYYEDAIFYNPYEVTYRDMLNNALFKVAHTTKEKVWLENVIDVSNKELKIVPQHYLAFFALGNAYYLLSQNHGEQTIDMAIENYEKAIDADPFQPEMYHHLALSYIKKGMFNEAAETLKKAIINGPNIEYIDKLARIYLEQDRLDEARKLFDETPVSDTTASFCNAKGFFLAKIGEKEGAYIEFAKALKIEQDNIDALNNVINLGLILNKTDDTINHLKHAVELKPSNIDYRMNLAELYAQKGLINESVAEFDQIIQTDPNRQVDCLDKLGKIFVTKKAFDNAIVCFNKAIEINPSKAELYNNLGAVYAQKKLYDEATSEINKALAIAPDNITFLGNIAEIYYIQESFEKAENILNHIIRLDENNKQAKKLLEQIRQKKIED